MWKVIGISIHTFLAEGDAEELEEMEYHPISIHTFLAEGDGGAFRLKFFGFDISIHTFLAEGDVICFIHVLSLSHFNPHLPRGR